MIRHEPGNYHITQFNLPVYSSYNTLAGKMIIGGWVKNWTQHTMELAWKDEGRPY
jgi:hypothetical protein